MGNENFEVGDVVVLKSGTTKMTIEGYDGEEYDCVWHNVNDELKQHTFNPDLLKKVDDDTPLGIYKT